MKITKIVSKQYTVLEINSPDSVINFELGTSYFEKTDHDFVTEFHDDTEGVEISEKNGGLLLRKKLGGKEHILGLGEKAFELDRRRISVKMWNTDSYSYGWYTDPLYVSIPFFVSVEEGRAKGYFVNSLSKVNFDIGVDEYDKIQILVPEKSVTIFVIQGPQIEAVLESYSALTGKPFLPPLWALGHQISRYSYFPDEKVVEVVERYSEVGIPVSALYLDIDYTEDRKIFTWNKKRFPDPSRMIGDLHSKGVRVIANVNPGVKIDQNYDIFKEGIGTFCETPNHEIYTGPVWSGLCAFPDFLNDGARRLWKKWLTKFVSMSGLDGIWLDMNEPSVFGSSKTIDESVIHKLDNSSTIEHKAVHNGYAYFQALATYDALSEVSKSKPDKVPFVLTRAGYAGIQRFAAIWSGDNFSSWENMRLQIPLLLDLSMSGVPFVGCDIGGFVGRSDPELLTRFYQLAAFFPLFRNHKTKEGNDQEVFNLPSRYIEKIKRAISLRYSLMPYLYHLAVKAHRHGHPIIRPLAYEFPQNEDAFHVNDEYMVGKNLLYAPHLEQGRQEREVYLTEDRWTKWGDSSGRIIEGQQVLSSDEEMPLYLRFGSVVPSTDKIVIWGKGESTLWDKSFAEIKLVGEANALKTSEPLNYEGELEFKEVEMKHARIDDKNIEDIRVENGSTFVKVKKSFSEIVLY